MTPIDRTSDRPAYQQIADELREKIVTGILPEKAKLPSERELSEEYEAARVTVRQAIAVLRGEGLISAEHGRGIFVRQRRPIRRIAQKRLSPKARSLNQSAFLADTANAEYEPSVKVAISVEGADSATAEILNIDPGDEVLVRDRVMLADGEPVQLATSVFTRKLAGGTRIEQEDTGPGGVHARLAELGREPVRFVEKITVRMPSPEIRKELRIDNGIPVIHIIRVALDKNSLPVEVNYMTLAADRYELVYEFSFESEN
ncbi:GntR family transcriptional regulator [Candidatus Protofrankia californiensis]|uniref:GntR family transcriptional regulator n=1 Tax=Candidatus Protofrankia californiensis TaxID=1839754 RepID=UPI0010418CB4|nr:GntR family transcriptional regulator [Candidatus Protofrankia californiensis]